MKIGFNVFDLKGFLNGKFCVYCETDELKKDFMEFLENNTSLKWKSGQKPTEIIYTGCIVYYGRDSLGGRYLTYDNYSSKQEKVKWSKEIVLNTKEGEYIEMNKQQLENRIKELQNELEGLNKQLEEYNFPKKGELYYSYDNSLSFSDTIMVSAYYNNEFISDKASIKSGLYFKTEEEAENHGFATILRQRMLKFAEENNEEELDWDNKVQPKYRIVFYEGILDLDYMYTNKEPFQVYFSSKEVAEKALEEFKDDLLKLYSSNI